MLRKVLHVKQKAHSSGLGKAWMRLHPPRPDCFIEEAANINSSELKSVLRVYLSSIFVRCNTAARPAGKFPTPTRPNDATGFAVSASPMPWRTEDRRRRRG
mmetsp:Transcript_51117/g.102516  ORF Transcript_51117/g.102516 Transcript_51117/m.102516 type:complete len:101 (+) Transcript_51117:554-856(+)